MVYLWDRTKSTYKMPRILPLVCVLILICTSAYSQSSLQKTWDKYYGGARADAAVDIIEDFGGGIAIAGQTKSKVGRKNDLFFLRLNPSGDTKLNTNFGGTEDDAAKALVQAFDGTYLLAGYTASKWAKSKGAKDAWIVKVDQYGEFIWDLICGGGNDDAFNDIVQLENEVYVAVGQKDLEGYLVCLDDKGEILWEKTRPSFTNILSLCINHDQSMTTVGYKEEGDNTFLVIQKFEINGEVLWEQIIKEEYPLVGTKILQNIEGGFTISGIAEQRNTREDKFILITDQNGNKKVIKPYGGRGRDGSRSMAETFYGDYLLAGYTGSHERAAKRHKLWLSFLSKNGEDKLSEPYFLGGKNQDEANDVLQLHDGSFIVAGYSASNKGLEEDAWVIKLKSYDLPNTNVDNDKISLEQGQFKDENENGAIEQLERAYLFFQITNNGDVPLYNAEAMIEGTKLMKGLEYFKKVKIGYLAANSSKKFSIPFFGEEDILTGESNFELSLIGANGFKKAPVSFSIESMAEVMPQLEIKNVQFKLPEGNKIAKRKEKISMEIEVENIGTDVAKNVGIKFSFPYKVKNLSEKSFKISSLSIGEKKTYTFEFEVEDVFLGDEVEIGIRAWEETFKGGDKYKAKMKMESFDSFEDFEEEPSKENKSQNEKGKGGPNLSYFLFPSDDNLSIEWLTPDVFESTDFEEESPMFAMKFGLKSNKEIYEEDISIFINGEKVPKDKYETESLVGKGETEKRYRYAAVIPLINGDNEIKVIVKNEAGEAEVVPIHVTYSPRKSKLFLLAIGVPFEDLSFTSKDAEDFANSYQTQKGGLFSEVNINILNTKASTTSQSLRLQLDELYLKNLVEEEISEDDMLILFISSHGLKSARGKFRIAASDYDLLRKTFTLDYDTEIVERLEEMTCKKMLFIDACYAGAAANTDAPAEGEKSGGPDDFDLSKAIAALAESSTDLNTMLSCSAGEKSFENKKWGHGAFTKALLEAFSGKEVDGKSGKIKADTKEDKIIYFEELYNFVKQRVPQLVKTEFPNKKQTPYVPEEQLEKEKPIFVLK